MNTQTDNLTHLREQFDRDGYAIYENALSPEEAQQLAEAIDRKIIEGPMVNGHKKNPDSRTAKAEHNVDVYQGTVVPEIPMFYGLPRITLATTAVAGPDWHFHLDANIFSTPPHGGKQGWHQDSGDMGPGIYFVNRIFFPRTISREQGPLIVVPGSHLRGNLPPGGQHEDIEGQIEILPKAGSLVFMCSRLWHRVGLNQSDTPRRNCIFRVRPWEAPKELKSGVLRVA